METSPRDAVAVATRALGAAGQSDLIWGHLSLRDPEGRGLWMKAAGWSFEEVDASRVLLVGWDGALLEGDGRVHVEYHIHAEILRARPDANAVAHTHAESANVFSSLAMPLPAISHDAVLFADPQIPRFTRTGDLVRDAELGRALAATLGDAPACLMPQHGLVTVGADEGEAVMRAVLLARACAAAVQSIAAGGPVVQSDAAEIAAKREHAWPPSQIQAGYAYLRRLAEARTNPEKES